MDDDCWKEGHEQGVCLKGITDFLEMIRKQSQKGGLFTEAMNHGELYCLGRVMADSFAKICAAHNPERFEKLKALMDTEPIIAWRAKDATPPDYIRLSDLKAETDPKTKA